MTPVLEEVLEKVNQLSLEDQAKLREVLEKNERDAERRKHLELVRSLKGKFKDSLSSVDEFIARKQEDINIEDKDWRPAK